jgi:hypothetical protein
MKGWEVVADRLSKAGWSLGYVSRLIAKGEQSGLPTRIATGNVTLCMLMKY